MFVSPIRPTQSTQRRPHSQQMMNDADNCHGAICERSVSCPEEPQRIRPPLCITQWWFLYWCCMMAYPILCTCSAVLHSPTAPHNTTQCHTTYKPQQDTSQHTTVEHL